MAKNKVLPKIVETKEIRDEKNRLKGTITTFHIESNNTFYLELKSSNSKSNVVWMTPVNDLSSKAACKSALRSLLKLVNLIK